MTSRIQKFTTAKIVFLLLTVCLVLPCIFGCGQTGASSATTTSTTTTTTILTLGSGSFQLVGLNNVGGGKSQLTYDSTRDAVFLIYSKGLGTNINWSVTQELSARGIESIFREKEKALFEQYGAPKQRISISSVTDQVGSRESFWVYNINSSTYYQITAECKIADSHALIYVDIAASMSDPLLADVANEFDTHIYSTVRQYFGDEANPGIDGDSRITLLFTPMVSNLYGYFDSVNEGSFIYSNRREMLTLNSVLTNAEDIKATMAHEFQHLVNYSQKTLLQGKNEQVWLNEGLSVLSEQLCGYGLAVGDSFVYGVLKAFEAAPQSTSLTNFITLSSTSYAPPYLFMLYLYEQYGPSAILSLESSAYIGTANVEYATGASFDDVFRDWVLTNYLDGMTALPRYNYASIDLRGTYDIGGISRTFTGVTEETVSTFPDLGNESIAAYACRYVRVLPAAGAGTRTIQIPTTTSYEARAVLGTSLK